MAEKRAKNKRLKPDPQAILAWYDRHRRVLPWRALKGQQADTYHVWLSEIMLQQTTVSTVGPYFRKFLGRWPTLNDLAQAELDDVLRMWAGLGYYRRARSLHACAQALVRDYGGVFPSDEASLLSLPGLGPYTVAAIRSIAFDQKANVVDGNVERVVSRLYAIEDPLPKGKKILRDLAAGMLPTSRFGDYAQAMMDLGATVCTPRSPKCSLCPWPDVCLAQEEGTAETFPRRVAAKSKPVRRGIAFVLWDDRGRALLRKRGDTGLLAGMMEVPSTDWREGVVPALAKVRDQAPMPADWVLLRGEIRHIFTHFELELRIAVATISKPGKIKGLWVAPDEWGDEALPTVMRKVLAFAYASKKEGKA